MSRRGQVMIDVADSGMSAQLTFFDPQDEERISFDEVSEMIEEEGIEFGVNWQKLRDYYEREIFDHPVTFASGAEMEPADDGRWELNFSTDKDLEGVQIQEDGSVDLRDLRRFVNVKQGQELARRRPPREGNSGMTVKGTEIPVQKESTEDYKPGRNVEWNEAGDALVAAKAGHASLMGNKITVLDRININSDVDYAVGNLDFGGDLNIRGDVNPGFDVHAGGDLNISGVVEQANIGAGGDLRVDGLIFGKNESTVSAGGDARLKGAESAVISVAGDLTVDHSLRHCNVQVGGKLEVKGRKTGILGGEIGVMEKIKTTNLGSPMSSTTRLELGINPILKNELEELEEEKHRLTDRQDRVKLGLKRLEKLASGGGLTPNQETLHETFSEQKEEIGQRLSEVRERIREIRDQLNSFGSPEVEVRDTVFPGVMVCMKGAIYKVNEQLEGVRFTYLNGKIKPRSN